MPRLSLTQKRVPKSATPIEKRKRRKNVQKNTLAKARDFLTKKPYKKIFWFTSANSSGRMVCAAFSKKVRPTNAPMS